MSLCEELNFLVNPARTLPFSKMRLVISFQRSSCSNFHHECYPIIEKLAAFIQQMSKSFVKEGSHNWQADAKTADSKVKDGDDLINKKYFRHSFKFIKGFANIFSSVPSNTTDIKWEPPPFVYRWFYATLYRMSIAFCELKIKQRWSSLHIHMLPMEWKGPERTVNAWRHLKYPRAVAFPGSWLWLNLWISFSHLKVFLEVELLITALDVGKKCVYGILCILWMNYDRNKNYWHFEIVYWYYSGFVSTKYDHDNPEEKIKYNLCLSSFHSNRTQYFMTGPLW